MSLTTTIKEHAFVVVDVWTVAMASRGHTHARGTHASIRIIRHAHANMRTIVGMNADIRSSLQRWRDDFDIANRREFVVHASHHVNIAYQREKN